MSLVEYGDNSDDEGDGRERPFSLTNFMFGNVSESGALESDYLEEDAKEHLENLNTKDLNCLTNQIRDVKLEVDLPGGAVSPSISQEADDISEKISDELDGPKFLPGAVDFSDFNETLDDDYDEADRQSQSQEDISMADNTAPIKESSPELPKPVEDLHGDVAPVEDHRALPPPRDPDSLERELQAAADDSMASLSQDSGIGSQSTGSNASLTHADPAESVEAVSDNAKKHQLNTPLASVLPPELADVNVLDVFPDFKSEDILRFSRLFGPGRPSSLPKRWSHFRKNPIPPELLEDTVDSDEDDDAILERACREAWPISKPIPKPHADIQAAAEVEPIAEKENAPDSVEVEQPKRLSSAAIPPWRYGPAQYWYDQYHVDPTGENFDYGASQKKRETRPAISSLPFGKMNMKVDVNDEAFLMVSLTNWEDDVIWDSASVKREVDKILAEKRTAAGWLPNTTYRTAAAFLAHGKSTAGQPPALDLKHDSIFPAENDELINGNWEKDIIWDADNIEDLPEPAILMLDPNDPNLILNIPDEEEFECPVSKEPTSMSAKEAKEKKDMYKRSRMVLGKAGMLKEPLSPKAPHETDSKNQYKDPFNLSNDEYYSPKVDEGNLKTTTGAVALQHSIPAMQLYQCFFPTIWGLAKLRQFHRNALKKYSNGHITHPGAHPVKSLMKNIRKREKQREEERLASGGGEIAMRIPEDLTVQDGEIILAEYGEEHVPLISQVGMGTRIKNYLKRKPDERRKTDEDAPVYEYGEQVLTYTSPFLGTLAVGQSIQAFENNMFRAPIYQHRMPRTDFLIARTRNCLYIREVPNIFTVGQLCPLIEVPAPKSKKATNFERDFLAVHIYRLFHKSTDTPKRVIKTDDLKKLFAHASDATLRKRLKLCADMQRAPDSKTWVLKTDFRLPSEEEIRALVTPEDYCAYHSMRSAERRLEDAGYREKLILAPEDDGDEEQQSKMDDEIKAAPWNTTRAFIGAMKNKCILQLTGDADPTGCGQGFSYVKVPTKVDKDKDGPTPAKRIVTGTDADLRKLSLNNAKSLLRKFGCKEEKIKALSRWEIIALVRTLGSQQAKAGTEESMSKFARGNRFSAAEQHEKYKEDCQRIFELQNRILASDEVLSTDEESSEEEEDSDLDELGRNLDSIIQSKKSSKELHFEQEEEQRKKLKKLIEEEADAKDKDAKLASTSKVDDEPAEEGTSAPIRKLKIVRTFRDAGSDMTFDRVEYVSRPALIDAYVRIKETNDLEFIHQFASLDSDKKDKKRLAKRQMQEQLRKLKRAAGDPNAPPSPEPPPKKKYGKKKNPAELKVKCGACGKKGHMRTNKALCSKAEESFTVAMTKEQEDMRLGNLTTESGLVKVEGAKITLKKEVLNKSEQIRRQSLIVKIPKGLTEGGSLDKEERRAMRKERREREEGDRPLGRPRKIRRIDVPDYLEKPKQATARRRVDPVVSLASELEVILNELRDLPNCEPFRTPVSKKSCPLYAQYVADPMDLSTMRTKLNQGKYKSREDFLTDVGQIVRNSEMFNGKTSGLTMEAKKLLTTCLLRFGENEEIFKRLEKQINPLLDDDDQVALSYLLQQIIQNKLRPIEGSALFHQPVDKRKVASYYDVIKSPMDFETMEQKTKTHQYHTADQFLQDVRLILSNCIEFNTIESGYTRTAEQVVHAAETAVNAESERIKLLEAAIRNTQEAAMEAAETESVGTHVSDSDRPNKQRLSSVFSTSNMDVDDSETRGTGVFSETGDGELSHSPEPGDVFSEDRQDDESFSRNSASSPPLFLMKKQLRLSMGSSYYEDAQTGYEDDHYSPVHVPAVASTSQDEDGMESNSGAPAATGMSTLEDDLNVSDSDSDGDADPAENPKEAEKPTTEAGDEEDDVLWF